LIRMNGMGAIIRAPQHRRRIRGPRPYRYLEDSYPGVKKRCQTEGGKGACLREGGFCKLGIRKLLRTKSKKGVPERARN